LKNTDINIYNSLIISSSIYIHFTDMLILYRFDNEKKKMIIYLS